MADLPKIALLLETSRAYGRGLLRGIIRYSRLHGPWNLEMSPGHFEQELPVIRRRGLAGIIARISSPKLAQAIRAAGVPAIALEASFEELATINPKLGICEIRSDSRTIACMAAEHLRERGFRHLAYCGIPNCLWSEIREKTLVQSATESGCSSHVYRPPQGRKPREWQKELPHVSEWLHSLPKPVGVLAGNDDRGRKVLMACRAADLRVPEDIAVVGVDNDELLCEVCNPPMSSVSLDLEAAGYAAAELLDGMVAGRVKGHHEVSVKPLAVVTRRSTDVMVQDDAMVAAVLQFIRDNAARPIGVPDVVEQTELSRTSVERRFLRAVGHTILEEITHRRMERARRLLAETELAMERVSTTAGFSNVRAMTRAFTAHEGCSPWQYRKTNLQ